MSRGICIWAHSRCRSTFGLYREVVRQADVPVRLSLYVKTQILRTSQGFDPHEYADLPVEVVGEDKIAADRILRETVGWVHVVCAYQASKVNQMVMRAAHARGDRVVVYSEAPCEMCVGARAILKRLYYRFVLPWKMCRLVKCADLILSQSGTMGMDRLIRLGWRREQIIPFGYVTDRLDVGEPNQSQPPASASLRVLHLGNEAGYRGVEIVERAVEQLRCQGIGVELFKTGGRLPLEDVVKEIRRADVVVACGFCEPWGMRVNDALMEGTPVIVSDGMGVAWLVEKYGCGCVVPKGDVGALAKVLGRCANDRGFLGKLKSGAQKAAACWTPEKRAKEFLRYVLPQ